MSGVIPIPNTRVSNLLLTQRLTQQLQSDQLDLFRIQEQISTGQRVVLPSDDAPAALRAIALQRLIERKTQLESNINSGQVFLAATDSALSEVANALNSIKSETLSIVGTVTSQEQRDNAVNEINRALETLVTLGNRQIQGRHLFAGSQTSQVPYAFDGDNIIYLGNDTAVRNHSDLGILFASNATGQTAFGGISETVQGSVDLIPQLNAETQLGSLRGGRGINSGGAISISDGNSNNASVIDLSNASTIGDVVRLIEDNPPQGRQVNVQITGSGLTLSLDSGNIVVSEVGSGTTARELGILEDSGTATQILGDDLDPILLKTTLLSDILGTKARTVINSGANGDNADILLEASVNGAALDGVTVQFVDDSLLQAGSGLSAGNEIVQYHASAQPATAALTFSGAGNDLVVTSNSPGSGHNGVTIRITDGGAVGDVAIASYNSSSKTIEIAVDNTGATTVQSVIDAINSLPGPDDFTAAADSNSPETLNTGAFINAADIGVVTGQTGSSGGEAKTLYVQIKPGVSTANDVVSAINAEGTFTAALDPSDTTSPVQQGTGKVNLGTTAVTSGGSGGPFDQTSGIRVVNGGETHDLSFDQAETVEDLLNILNSSGAGLLAEINAQGTGVDIRSRLSGKPFQIGELGGDTATQLGIRTFNSETRLSDLNYGNGVPPRLDRITTFSKSDLEIIASDGQVFSVDLSTAIDPTNPSDVINAINLITGADVTAQLDAAGTGIELIDNTAGLEHLSVTQSGTEINGGISYTLPSDDIAITASTGDIFRIDLSTLSASGNPTVGELIAEINSVASGFVTAQLAQNGNGIELVDDAGGSLRVTKLEGSQAAEFLGLVEKGKTQNDSVAGTLTGEDRNYYETDSVFNTLISLRDAIEANDLPAIERTAAKLDDDIDRVTFARADVGARGKGLDLSLLSLSNEEIQLRSALSDEIDVDLVEAISQLTSRQVALQASLQVSANLLQLSLLNFL